MIYKHDLFPDIVQLDMFFDHSSSEIWYILFINNLVSLSMIMIKPLPILDTLQKK